MGGASVLVGSHLILNLILFVAEIRDLCFLVADTRLYTLACRLVGLYVIMRKTAGDQGSVQTLMNLSRILYQNLSVNDNIRLIFFVLTNLKYVQKF